MGDFCVDLKREIVGKSGECVLYAAFIWEEVSASAAIPTLLALLLSIHTDSPFSTKQIAKLR
jgi:hypothetical protein